MKNLTVFPERCTNCHICELYCSLVHFNVINPARSRIHIVGQNFSPIVCIQCRLCLDSCPVEAIFLNKKTGAAIIDEEKCIGCRECVVVCPYGAITMDPVRNKALKCDLCDGDPECVKRCPEAALAYIDVERGAYLKRLAYSKMYAVR